MRPSMLITLLLPVAFSQGSNEFECPEETGLYPDIYDCTRYIECDKFEPTFYQCPDNLVFNRKTKSCDWRRTTGCDEVPKL